jgi:hypothetical protein
MFDKAVKAGLIDPQRSVQNGIRTWNDDFMGFHVLDAPWVHERGVKATIERIVSIVGDHPAYFTSFGATLDWTHQSGWAYIPLSAGGFVAFLAALGLRKISHAVPRMSATTQAVSD